MMPLAAIVAAGICAGFIVGRWWAAAAAILAVPLVVGFWTIELWPPHVALFVIVAVLSAAIGIQARAALLGRPGGPPSTTRRAP